jgi:hypothetical protein
MRRMAAISDFEMICEMLAKSLILYQAARGGGDEPNYMILIRVKWYGNIKEIESMSELVYCTIRFIETSVIC